MYRPLARSVLEKSLPILMPRERRSQNSPEHSGYQQLSARSYPMKRRLPPEPCGLSKTTRRTPNSKPTRIQALNLSTDLGGLLPAKNRRGLHQHTPHHTTAKHNTHYRPPFSIQTSLAFRAATKTDALGRRNDASARAQSPLRRNA